MPSSLFTGREYHRNVGIYDYRNRAYDPDLGCFLQRDPPGNWGDPVNFGNAYAYVGGDPGNGRDPWGNLSVCCRTSRGDSVDRLFQHCELKDSCGSVGKDEESNPVWVDCSSSRSMDNGKTCDCVTKQDIEDCMRRHPYSAAPRGVGASWGDNCQTSTLLTLGFCCLKSTWKPMPYAGPVRGKSRCKRGHVVWYGPPIGSEFVCDEWEWEVPSWNADKPPAKNENNCPCCPETPKLPRGF